MIPDQVFLELTKRVEPFVNSCNDIVRYEVKGQQRVGIRFPDSFIPLAPLRHVSSICRNSGLSFYITNTCHGFSRGDVFIVIYQR